MSSDSPDLSKLMADQIDRAMTESFTEQVARPGNFKGNLTVEGIQAMMNRFYREQGRFYVLSTEALPDDCYGIIYLRPEDAAKVKAADKLSCEKGQKDG